MSVTTTGFDPIDCHPSNMPRMSQWVSNDDGRLVCGECMHNIIFARVGLWNAGWSNTQIEQLAADRGWERMPDGTDDFCSDCDKDF